MLHILLASSDPVVAFLRRLTKEKYNADMHEDEDAMALLLQDVSDSDSDSVWFPKRLKLIKWTNIDSSSVKPLHFYLYCQQKSPF